MRSQDGEARKVNKIINEGHTEQSSSEAESDSDSVLCTLSTDIEDMGICYLMYSLHYAHIFVQICSTGISYTLLWNNSHFHIQQ